VCILLINLCTYSYCILFVCADFQRVTGVEVNRLIGGMGMRWVRLRYVRLR
jgi:hypothetical protein